MKRKKVVDRGVDSPVEVSFETGRTEMHWDSVVVLLPEMEAPDRYEIDA